MITLTRLNGRPVMLNCDLIESVEENGPLIPSEVEGLGTGETVITLTTGNVVIVREPMTEIEQRVVAFKKSIYTVRHRDA